MNHNWIIFLLSLQVLASQQVQGFPYGAPHKSCSNLYPKHGGVNSMHPCSSPYKVEVVNNNNNNDDDDNNIKQLYYAPGDTLTITLEGREGESFRGFIVVANRLVGDTEELIGGFVRTPAHLARNSFWYPPDIETQNCVTHLDNSDKRKVVLQWKAPSNFSFGDIVFKVTFVANIRQFWVDVQSNEIIASVPAPKVSCQSCLQPHTSQEFSLDGCGQTKGCVLFPTFCTGDACTYVIMYREESDGIHFEVKAKTDGYVTWAISKDKLMGGDNTVTCINTKHFVSVQYGYNPSRFNDRHRVTQLKNISTRREDGYIYCSWVHPYVAKVTHVVERPGVTPELVTISFDLREPWYLFLAYGDLYSEAAVLNKHTEHPIITFNQVRFSDKLIHSADSLPMEMKIHASLAIVAWISCVGIAKVIARHSRGLLTAVVCDKVAWFRIHQSLVISALLLTLGLVGLMFVKLWQWTNYAQLHGLLGLSLMAVVVVQSLLGCCRPGSHSKGRAAFAWVHGLLGHSAHALSAVTMFFVLYSPIMHQDLQFHLTIVFAIWVGLDIIFEVIVFEGIICYQRHWSQKGLDVVLAGDNVIGRVQYPSASEERQESRGVGVWVVLGLYILCMLALSAIALAYIYLF